jgi:hypothetical protein
MPDDYEKLKKDAEHVQNILARHLGDQCQCDGIGPASYDVARSIEARAADAIQSLTRQDEKMRAMMKERFEAIMDAVQDQDYGAVFVIAKIGASMLAAAPAPTKGE